MIELSHIHQTYRKGNQTQSILKDISLTLSDNLILGVIGQSGAGKSTLVRLLNLLEAPSSGQIKINGQPIAFDDPSALQAARRQIGTVFQHFYLFNAKTIFQNIALPLEIQGIPKAEIHARVTELLHLVGLPDKAAAYPAELSGGQKQRVAIARALSTRPSVLLCDEATSALDPQNTQAILQLLKTIQTKLGICIVMVTHEMQVVKRLCQRVAVLDEGRLVECQDVVNLFINPQHAATKKLIENDGLTHLPAEYLSRLSTHRNTEQDAPVLRLWFQGEHTRDPLITQLIRNFNLTVNIIEGNIEPVANTFLGHLVVELWGEQDTLQAAQAFLQKQLMRVETLAYVARH